MSRLARLLLIVVKGKKEKESKERRKERRKEERKIEE